MSCPHRSSHKSRAYVWLRRESTTVANAPLRSIAVLPFKPLVATEMNETLEMGMAETLITQLSSINQVTVRPMSAVRSYTGNEQDSVAAGRGLGVDCVLDGNIQKDGDQLRITARLVRVSDGTTIWTDKFDTKLTDIFSTQDSISRKGYWDRFRRKKACIAIQLCRYQRRWTLTILTLNIRRSWDMPMRCQVMSSAP